MYTPRDAKKCVNLNQCSSRWSTCNLRHWKYANELIKLRLIVARVYACELYKSSESFKWVKNMFYIYSGKLHPIHIQIQLSNELFIAFGKILSSFVFFEKISSPIVKCLALIRITLLIYLQRLFFFFFFGFGWWLIAPTSRASFYFCYLTLPWNLKSREKSWLFTPNSFLEFLLNSVWFWG